MNPFHHRGLPLLIAAALLLLSGCRAEQHQTVTARTAPAVGVEEPAGSIQTGEDSFTAPQAEAAVEETDPTASTTHGDLLEKQTGDVVEIPEKLFIAQANDIYYNAQDYLGKTLVYEGIYKSDVIVGSDGEPELVHYVIRYGPGCCDFDDSAGFEVVWDGAYPLEDEWVEVAGVLEEFEQDGWKFLQVRLTQLTVKQERGAEYVSQ